MLLAALLSRDASGQELRDLCPDRPGLGTPACTVDRGHAITELGLADWAQDRQSGNRSDTLLVADALVRYGVTDSLEAQLGWTAFGHVRERSDGITDRNDGTGDLLVAFRQNLRNPDGTGFASGVMPYLTLPAGGTAIGAGDWGTGLIVPISTDLPAGMRFSFTGSIEAAVDDDRDGRHLAHAAVVGLDLPAGSATGVTFEIAARRDRDPSGSVTEWLGGVSGAWSPTDLLQFDAGANIGLNRDATDLQLYLGVARRL